MGTCFSNSKNEKPSHTQYMSLGKDTGSRIVQKPLCFFGKKCTRQNTNHIFEFSHNELDYNGTRGSKVESCKKYIDTHVSQSHLGGGSAGMVQQPKSQFDDRYVRNAGLALITH